MGNSAKWAVVVAIAMITGCGTKLPQPQVQSMAQVQAPAQTNTYELLNESKHAKKWAAFLDQLDLTADQRTKIDALKDKMKKGDWTAKRQEFVDLIDDDTVDQAKLQTFFEGVVADFDARIKDKVGAIEEFRDILTPDQRTKSVQLMLDKMAGKKHRHGHGMRHRCMKFMHMMGGLSHRQLWPAAASFMLSGSKDALEKAFTSDKTPEERVKKLVEAIMGMDKDDRQELVERMKRGHKDDGATTPETPASPEPPASTPPETTPSPEPSTAPESPAPSPSGCPACPGT